jgi:hypothetical protein
MNRIPALFIFILLAMPLKALANIAFVKLQEDTTWQNDNSIATGNFSGAVSSANLMVCWIYYNSSTQSVSSLSDSGSNTYTKAVGPTTGSGTLASWRQEIWYAYNITGAGTFSVTATFSGTFNAEKEISCHEYSGALTASDPKDVTSSATGSTEFASSGSASTSQAGELIFGAALFQGQAKVGMNSTQRSFIANNVSQDRHVWATGSYSADFDSYGGEDWIAQMVTFKSATTSPPAIYEVQRASYVNDSTPRPPSASKAFAINNTAGNFIWVGFYCSGTGRTLSVSDTRGNTYTQAATVTQTTDGHQIWLYYAMNIAAGANTVTATATGADTQYFYQFIHEVKGIATSGALDKTVTAIGSSTTQSSGDTATTTAANELVAGMIGFSGGGNFYFTPGASLTKQGVSRNISDDSLTAGTVDRVVSSTGAYSVSTTTVDYAEVFSAIAATFKAATPAYRVRHQVRQF